MAFCVKCGAKVESDVKFCPQCGGEIPLMKAENASYEKQQESYQNYGQTYEQSYSNQGYGQGACQSQEAYFDRADVQQNKALAVISYLGLLVFISVFARDKRSEYTTFHVNQGLVLLIAGVIADALTGGGWFSWMSWFYYDFGILHMLSWVTDIALLVFLIMGIVNACKGVRKELPLIGKIKIFK